MQSALKKVASRVDELIKSDGFTQGLEPKFLSQMVSDYPERGGKRLRPALLSWSCQLLGGSEEQAIYPACAVEVFHNWTLVHDDIIDRDDVRRGVPTCHKQLELLGEKQYGLSGETNERFGRDFGILTGDLQQGWANSLLLKAVDHGVDANIVVAISRHLQDYVNRMLISGEAIDVELSYRDISTVNSAEIERMYELKTGVLLKFCAEAGAMIALNDIDRTKTETIALGKMAMAAAVAFQIQDDYLGIYGNSGFGKPLGADLSERKATLLLLHAMAKLSEAGKVELNNLLGKATYSASELAKVQMLFDESGAKQAVVSRMSELTSIAQEQLELLPQNCFRDYLKTFVEYMCCREV